MQDGVPERVLAERGYGSLEQPAYVSVGSSSSPGRAENGEQEKPGRPPYARRKQRPRRLHW